MPKECPAISLCMIVKNEEKNIVRCLSSVKDYVDEILVLDTGSTDWTPLLAREMGAIVRFAPWQNSFSEARNLSKQWARGEWIFFMDADEEISKETGEGIRWLAKQSTAEAYTFRMVNNTSVSENSPVQLGLNLRMFKNNPQYRFTGDLHEQIKPSILKLNPNACIEYSGLEIIHYGYCANTAKRKKKNLRNIKILESMLAENPNDGFSHYNLAVSYYVGGKLEKSKNHYQLAKKFTPKAADYYPSLYRNYAICLYDLGEYLPAIKLINEALAFYPDYPDLYYLKGQIYCDLKLYSKAKKCFLKCLDFNSTNPHYNTTRGVESYLSLEQLADIFYNLKEWDQAVEYQLKSINSGPKTMRAANRLAVFANKKFVNAKELEQYLSKELAYLKESDLMQVFFKVGRYQTIIERVANLTKPNADDLLLAAKSSLHLANYHLALGFINQIPQSSAVFFEAMLLGSVCCVFANMPGKIASYVKPIAKEYPAYAEAIFFIRDCLIEKNTITFPAYYFSCAFVDYVNQMIVFDWKKSLLILEKCLTSNQFHQLCYQLGQWAYGDRKHKLAYELFKVALRGKCTPEIYMIYGELCMMYDQWEGLYLIKRAAENNYGKQNNYYYLLKHVTEFFKTHLREILINYPQFQQVEDHLYSLANFSKKLGKEEEW